ncbi:hypothetical protein SARC_12387, partial [Sphaeroforma arctica JP610]
YRMHLIMTHTLHPCQIDALPGYVLQRPEGISLDQVFDQAPDSRVPPLAERWDGSDVTFGKFLGDTFKQYYEWSTMDKGAIEKKMEHVM